MYPVSDAFKEAIKRSHIIRTKCEVHDANGDLLDTLKVVSGNVNIDREHANRRTCTVRLGELENVPFTADDLLHTSSGNELRIYRGVVTGYEEYDNPYSEFIRYSYIDELIADAPVGYWRLGEDEWNGYAATVLGDGPVGYWRLGEGEGSTIAVDASGNGNDGTYIDRPILGVDSPLVNDGDTAMDTNNADGHLNLPTITFSCVEMWVRRDGDTGYLLDARTGHVGGWIYSGSWGHLWTGAGSAFYINGTEIATRSFTDLPLGEWAHVVLIATETVTDDLTIAARYTNTERLIGRIDEVAVYDRALTADEIEEHYIEGRRATRDSSGNGHHGQYLGDGVVRGIDSPVYDSKAASFPGPENGGGYVEVSDDPSFGSDYLTVESWLRFLDTPPGAPTFSRSSPAYLDGVEVTAETPRYPYGRNLLARDASEHYTGWQASSGTSAVAIVTTPKPFAGANATQVEAAGTHSYAYAALAWGHYVPVKAGETYIASTYVRPDSANRRATIGLYWYDSSATLLSTTFRPVAAVAADMWNRVEHSGVAPAGAVFLRLLPRIESADGANLGDGELWWASAAQVEHGSETTPWRPGGPSAVLIEEGTTNLLSENQASIETDATGWWALANTTVARDTGQAWVGVASLRLDDATTDSTANSVGVVVPTGTAGTPVTAGTVYTVSAYCRPGTTARSVLVRTRWYDAAGAFLSIDGGTTTPEVAGTWTRVRHTSTAPASAAFAAVQVDVLSVADGEVHYLDGAQVEAKGYATSWHPGGVFRQRDNAFTPNILKTEGTVEIEAYFSTGPNLNPTLCNIGGVLIPYVAHGSGAFRLRHHTAAAGGLTTTLSDTALSGWHRVAITWSAETDTVEVYLDGTLVFSRTADNMIPTSESNVRIGSWFTASDGYYWNNPIESLRISPLPRTAAELSDHLTPLESDEDTTYFLDFRSTLDSPNQVLTVVNRRNEADEGGFTLERESDGRLAHAVQVGTTWHRSKVTVRNDQWYHVAFTYDGSDLIVYHNGVEAARLSAAGVVAKPANALFRIARSALGASGQVDIDEVAVYNRALTVEEVLHHYNVGKQRYMRETVIPRTSQREVVEYVPLGVFGIEDTEISDSGEEVQIVVKGADRSKKVQRARFTAPYSIAQGTNYATAIQDLIEYASPGFQFNFTTTEHTTPSMVLGTGGWSGGGDPWEKAEEMAASIGMELFFGNNGAVILRPQPDPRVDPVVARYEEGPESTLLWLNRRITREDMFNHVIAVGNHSGLLAPIRAEAVDDDPASPTYYLGPFGDVPTFHRSTMIFSQSQAEDVAEAKLLEKLGTPENVRFISIVNPAHDVGDSVSIIRERIGVNAIHVLDKVNIPLEYNGSINASTRERRVLSA